MERDYDGDARIYAADLRAPQEIGRTAGLRAVERLSARKPPTGHYPVLFDERISSSLIGHLLAAANGASIARGSSWLLGKIGADVLPATLSLMEDPHRARVFGSRPFDAEGLPTHPRAIIENGRLTGWTTDLASARKLGLDSSANAARGVSAAPSPSNWNVALTQGTASRADLLKDNGKIFTTQGRIIDEVAAENARVAVVGNPANTNAMIAASMARRLTPDRFTAMVRLDQNRAQTMLAKKAGVATTEVSEIFIFGNHSPTMFPAFSHAKIQGQSAEKLVNDRAWLEGEFCEKVGKRGAAIIAARGASSATSAANALIDHVRDLVTPGNIHSVAVKSEGRYGFDPNVWAGMPVKTTSPGAFEVITGIEMDDFAKSKIAATNKELVEERSFVAEMLG